MQPASKIQLHSQVSAELKWPFLNSIETYPALQDNSDSIVKYNFDGNHTNQRGFLLERKLIFKEVDAWFHFYFFNVQ